MKILPWMAVLPSVLIGTATSFGADPQGLVGTWKVVSFEAVSPTTGERQPARGEHPSGYTIFTPEGRMSVLITNDGRKPPTTSEDRGDLFLTMVAYTGTYKADGDTWTTKVDVAANPGWIGTEQVRSFKLGDGRLEETTGLMPWSLHPEKGMYRFVITYERAK